MNQEQQTKEIDKTRIIGEFYYSLARLQTQATNYVAYGESDDDKLGRVQKIIELLKKTGAEIPDEGGDTMPDDSLEHCESPCYGDRNLMMCICGGGELNPN